MNLIDHLPRNSFYGDALAQDEEVASVELEPAEGETGPQVSEWSAEVDILTALHDAVMLIRSELWSLAGQKSPPRFRPTPRPMTAADRIENRLRAQKRDELKNELFPPTTD